MKPLKLTFEGLNSFERRQEIDMRLLTGAHLFGIFGPTGAGKSTVLDAMTLALYGEVVRAPDKTGGIMNTRRNAMYAELEFSLGARDERIYRVMREYVRAEGEKSDAAALQSCKLARVEAGREIVICSGNADELTQNVHKLIGLTMEDFVHSVMLPQGQFAEFLKMSGPARRDMLERLFHLEEFGGALSAKVQARESSVQALLTETEAALREVGNVTEAELKAAKVRRELDSGELDRIESESELAGSEAQDLRALYKLSQEKKEWQVRKLAHDANRSKLALINAELEAARRSDAILPIASRLSELESRRRELERTLHDSELALHQAISLSESVISSSREQKERINAEREKAQLLAGALETLAHRQAEINDLSASERHMLSELTEFERRSAENDAALADKEASIPKLQAYVKDLEHIIELGANTDIDRLGQGAAIERELDAKQAAYSEALSQLNSGMSELGRLRKAIEAIQQRARTALAELNQAQADGERADAEFIESAARAAAAQLARGLSEGKPCPVCGALHHPAPASEVARSRDRRAEAGAARERAQARHSEILQELARANQQYETQEAAHAEQSARAEKLRAELSGATNELEKLRKATGFAAMRDAYAAALENQTRYSEAGRKLTQARARLDAYRRQVQDYRMEQLKLHNRVDALREKLSDTRRLSHDWADELKRLKLPENADIAASLQECYERLKKADKQIEKIDGALTGCQQRREEANRRALAFRAQLAQLDALISDNAAQLAARLAEAKFRSVADAASARRAPERIDELARQVQADAAEQLLIDANLKRLSQTAQERDVTEAEMNVASAKAETLGKRVKELIGTLGALEKQIEDMTSRLKRRSELEARHAKLAKQFESVEELKQVLRGDALVEYVANQYLEDITRMAGEKLMFLTGNRYGLGVNREGFVIRDMAHGGVERAAASLSGGETFLVSLALALSLSMHINLKGQPLGFFFLDEGFGALDEKLIGAVMDALNMLAGEDFSIGVISHVTALRERIPARLIISMGPNGSTANIELA